MARLLPLILVTALAISLPPLAHGLSSNWWAWLWGGAVDDPTPGPERAEIGPGCVDGDMQYPGIPSDVASQCPGTDPPQPVIVTNEYDCSSYFLCEEGVADLICCPSGMLYDPPMLTCDDPPHVDCGSRPILPPRETTTTTSTTTTSTTETTTIPDETTTEPVTTPTEPDTTPTKPDTTPTEPDTTPTEPDTTPTEPDTTTTEPETTTTESTTTTTTTTAEPVTTTPPPPPIDSKCDDLPGYFGNLPVDGDCTAYYECDGTGDTEGTINYCKVGDYGQMVYNPTTNRCDDQWHYPCEDHMIHSF